MKNPKKVKKPETNVEKITSEKLALMLDQQYSNILQAQQGIGLSQNNIKVIKDELEKRVKPD